MTQMMRHLWFCSICIVFLSLSINSSLAGDEATTFYPPSDSTAGLEYQKTVSSAGIKTDLLYVDKTTQNFLTDDVKPTLGRQKKTWRGPWGAGDGYGVFLAVPIILILLFLFMKYGSPGGLMDRGLQSGRSTREKAEDWGVSKVEPSNSGILDQIKTMTDQREALILLLRHCLLCAAEETETGFARADTEREALNRLPISWRGFKRLENLLFQSELVHYGGRQLDVETFQACLSDGQNILSGSKGVS